MSLVSAMKNSLGAVIALKLAIVMLVLTALAATVITIHQERQMEEMTLEKARLACAIGAHQYGEILDSVIDTGTLTVADVFDKNYVPIKGFDFGSVPRYHTRYDSVTDRVVLMLQDKFLDYADFIAAIGVDENGYVPTHDTRYSRPITGDVTKDLANNRTKRLLNDPLALAAAQSLEAGRLQVYKRDSGDVLWDISTPIFVKGKHWGAFRLAMSIEHVKERQRSLLAILGGSFAVFFVVTIATMFLVTKSAMKPVVALTAAAERMSLGEELDTPLKATSANEIGQLTKTIDRLRISMKAAMSRISK